MKNKNLLFTIVIIVVVAGGAFFTGMQYQKSQRGQFGNLARTQGQFGNSGGNGTRPVTGSILSVDANSMTVKLLDGSSKIVLISGTTSINKAAKGTISDLKAGERAAAFGTANSDGSITAQNIQLNPTVRRGGESQSGTPSAQ